MLKFKSLSAIIIVLFLITASCGGVKEITVPCTEKGRSDATFFRASSSAKSRDMAAAKDKALISAKQMLASFIGTSMKSVTDNYMSQAGGIGNSALSQSFENITREVVNQQVKGLAIACEKTQKTKDGQYESFVAVEAPKAQIVSSIVSRISEDASLKTDFDAAKFNEIVDKELKK